VEVIETERLRLRRPRAADVPAIFSRYASDPEVTRYLAWPTHRTLDDTAAFVAFSDAQWTTWPAGPYLVLGRDGVTLFGGAGLVFQRADSAVTGYVLACDVWGRGYATEALAATIACARRVGVQHLEAGVHVEHEASRRVLEKAGFVRQSVRSGGPSDFPNLPPGASRAAYHYTLDFS
jgi:ribosomal-protein-alanine N-acetyltransferase